MLKRILTLLILCAAFATPWFAVAEEEQLPHEIIETAANAIVGEIKRHKKHLNENRDELYKLINEILMPHFDMRYAGRLVLGKHWKSASDEQRNLFIDVFYEFLLQSYANGVLRLDKGEIVVHPVDIATDDKRTVVKTDMSMDDGTQVPVNYSMRNSRAGWRVYDVQIEGVSYIRNYRNQFNAEISAMGMEAVIERLQSETKKSAAKKKPGTIYSSNSSSKSSS